MTVALALGVGSAVGCGDEAAPDGNVNGNGNNANNGAAASGGGTGAVGGGTGAVGGGTGAVGGGTGGAGGGTGPVCANGAPSFDELKAQAIADNAGVDFTALADTITYKVAYSAYIDDSHVFKVPFWLYGVEAQNPSEWSVYPAGAVIYEADPDNKGVLAEVKAPCERILIVYSAGGIGGMAELNVTIRTPEEYAAGEDRFNNGADWTLPDLTMIMLPLPGQPVPADQKPPPDTACTVCHTDGAKYFKIINTPTQAAKFSDQELIDVFTLGVKPEDPPCYRVLPPDLQYLYVEFHTWGLDELQTTGMVTYLRSLTPQGQGDIEVPDMGSMPPGGMECLRK